MIARRFWLITACSAVKLPWASGPRWWRDVELCLDDRADVAGLVRDEPADAAHQAAAVGGTLLDMPGAV